MVFHLVGISLWVGGLVAFLGLARQHVKHLQVIAGRYSSIALWAFIAVALSGFGNAWVRIDYVSDLWTTDYGRLVLLKAGLLTVLGMIGYLHRKRTLPKITDDGDRRPLIRLAVVEIGIMAVTIGVASALARTATPPPSGRALTSLEIVLGYDLDAGPSFCRPAHPVAVRLAAGHRDDRRSHRVPAGRSTAALPRGQLAGRPDRGLGDRLPDGRAGHVIGVGQVCRGAVLDPHDGAHAARHDRADHAGAGWAGHLGVAGAARRRPGPTARVAGGDRGRAAQPSGAFHHPPAGGVPAVRALVLRAVFLLAVRGDDRLAPRAPGDEPALPVHRLSVLLGDHRCRSVAATGPADDQVGDADRGAAVPRVLRARA